MVFPLNYSTLLSLIKKKKSTLEQEKRKYREIIETELIGITTPLDHEKEYISNDDIHDLSAVNEGSLFFSFVQYIANNMPNLPSDHVNEIIEVDFPTEIAVATFYQLLSQMKLLGSTIFHKCTIVRLLSFTDWNRKYSFSGEQFINGVGICDDNDESSYPSTTSYYHSPNLSSSSSSGQSKKSTTLEIVVQLQYLSPQSELFSKIFHYFSTTIFLGPVHPYGKYVTRLTIPIPSISTIEPILKWLYDHDDKSWMDTITSKNFDQVCQNAIFLGLSDDAFSVLEKVFQKLMKEEQDFFLYGL